MKIFLKIIKYLFISLLSVVLIFNIINIVQRVVFNEEIPMIFGYSKAVVITGSMKPTINIDDMVIIHQQKDYEKNDIVLYQSNNYITHRIVEITENGFITQGDANNTVDDEIMEEQIVGKVVMIIPKVGIIINFFQSPFGILILVIGFVIIIEGSNLMEKVLKRRWRYGKNS